MTASECLVDARPHEHELTVCFAFHLPFASGFSSQSTMRRSETIGSEYRKISPFESESLDPESQEIDSEEDVTLSPPPAYPLLGCAHRLCLLFAGLSIGFITIFPNGMMSDSGTRMAVIFSNIGVWASLLFCVAGIVGAVTKKSCLFKYACGLQLIALSPMLIATLLWLLGLREEP
jgi:hypothetical protein